MDEQQAIRKARLDAITFVARVDDGIDPYPAARDLAAALEGMALVHEQRLCKCGHKYSLHHGLTGGDCLANDGCMCIAFEESV